MRWQPYPQYKQSRVEWLGDIPEHWRLLKIKRLSSVKRGASPRPIDDPIYFDDTGEYSWVRISDVTASNNYLLSTTQRLSELGKSLSVPLEPGEIFLSIAGSVGKPIITGIKCCIHDGFVYFPDYKQDKKFLYYVFASGQPYLGLGKLGTQLNLNTDTVGDIRFALPPLPEQRVIAAFLDQETKRIDTLIAKKERQIELLQEKRAALICQAVTKGLHPNAKMKDSGIEWFGEIPEHWEVYILRRVARRIQTGSTPPTAQEHYYEEGTIPWYGPGSFSVDLVLHEPVKLIAKEAVRDGVARLFCHGSAMIVAIGATIGKVGYIEHDASCNQQITVVTFDERKAVGKFAAYQLKSLEPVLQSIAPSTTLPIMDQGQIGDLPIALPSLQEQEAIAVHIDRETHKVDALIRKVEESIARLEEYRKSLISSVVTGKIDVRKEVS